MAWWRRAVLYEIYVRSFQDSNGDGIGDLNGVTARLDYLRDLGVDGIWLTPFYPSPQVDFGYDITDYEDVDPQFGTLDDFDRLVREARQRSIRIVTDLILNHTSDRHPWFESSRASRSSPYREWYIWRDGSPDGGPPNNWESAFGGPAWTFDESTRQWYYHSFYPEQPDLNWRLPDVERRMQQTVGFWMDRGVDGFRLDAVNALFEDPDLRDNPPLARPVLTLTGVRTQEFVHTRGRPELHDVLRRLRQYVDGRTGDVALISEAYLDDPEELASFYGKDDEVHLPFNFFLAQVPSLDAGAFRAAVEEVEAACAESHWPSLVLSNHDIERACDRYARDADSDRIAKLVAMLLFTLRGTPFMYYGEEIGMRTEPPSRVDLVRDPVGRRFWPGYKGRDGSRRPMPWNGDARAGFTSGTPWLEIPSDARTRNVAGQTADAGSVLTFYRSLLRLRRRSSALRDGTYRSVASDSAVFAYLRQAALESALVMLNMTGSPCPNPLVEAARAGSDVVAAGRWRVALGTHREAGESIDLATFPLRPFEGVVLSRFAEPGTEN